MEIYVYQTVDNRKNWENFGVFILTMGHTTLALDASTLAFWFSHKSGVKICVTVHANL